MIGHPSIQFELSEVKPVYVRFSLVEANPFIQAIRRLTRWPRRQVNRLCPRSPGKVECLLVKESSNTLPPGLTIHNNIFNPSTNARRNRKNHERQAAINEPVLFRNQEHG